MGGGEIQLSDPEQAALCERMDWNGKGYLIVARDLREYFLGVGLFYG